MSGPSKDTRKRKVRCRINNVWVYLVVTNGDERLRWAMCREVLENEPETKNEVELCGLSEDNELEMA
jgi:hypothetical protein